MFQALINLLKIKPKAAPVQEVKIEDTVKVEEPKVEEVKAPVVEVEATKPAPAPAPKPAVKKASNSKPAKPKANPAKSTRKKK